MDIQDALAVLHFNSTSSYKHFSYLKHFLKSLKRLRWLWYQRRGLTTTKWQKSVLKGMSYNQLVGPQGKVEEWLVHRSSIKQHHRQRGILKHWKCSGRPNSRNWRWQFQKRMAWLCVQTTRNKWDHLQWQNVRNAECTNKTKIACGDFNVDLVNPLRLNTTMESINSV